MYPCFGINTHQPAPTAAPHHSTLYATMAGSASHSRVQLDVESTLSTTNLHAPLTREDAQQLAYTRPADAVLRALGTDPDTGLHADEVAQRQQQYGPNELADDGGVSYLSIFLRQVLNAMTLVRLLPFTVCSPCVGLRVADVLTPSFSCLPCGARTLTALRSC